MPPDGAVAVAPETALSFHGRANDFYQRLIQRRFNTLETFNDLVLREHFETLDSFFDYYADLAEKFHQANFDKSRPNTVVVEEFVFEDPGRVRVQIRFIGDDDRPLRPDRTQLIRRDLWERKNGSWWVRPAKL